MLDNPEKTRELVIDLKAALPFEVELTPEVIESLRTDDPTLVVEPKQIVSEVSQKRESLRKLSSRSTRSAK